MKYGLIADIHANLEALTAVLKVLEDEAVDRVVCAGDIIGYGADPRECIARVRDLDAICVAGNHDYAVVGQTPIDYFNPFAREAVLWTQDQLGKEEHDFIGEMSLMRQLDGFTIVHASPEAPAEWNYVYSTHEAARSFDALETRLCFNAHSHIAVVFVANGSCRTLAPADMPISPQYRYIVNMGSVGQPRDGDYRASCCLYDSGTFSLQMKRVEYDVDLARRKIIEAGLPHVLALRLLRGE